jgi:hypothetical protein
VGTPGSAPSSAAERVLLDALRAGTLGAGAAVWTLGVVVAMKRDHVGVELGEQPALATIALVAGCAALGAGFTRPVRSYLAIAGRLVGSAMLGVPVFAALVVGLGRLLDRRPIYEQGLVVAFTGIVVVGLAVAWIHGARIRERLASSRRVQALTVAAGLGVALATLSAVSAEARCALGSGRGCRRAAIVAHEARDDAAAARLAERGCALEDALSCVLAGDAAAPADAAASVAGRRQAETFYRDACALGQALGCEGLRLLELRDGCDAQRASACRELGQASGGAHVPGAPDARAAAAFLRDACRLGDDAACVASR